MKRIGFLALLSLCAGSALADKVVNIGFSGPLSGGAAAYGKDTLSGLQMAVDTLNKSGGIKVGNDKVTFKVVSLDDRYLPNETATNVKRLTGQDIQFIFVPHAGGIQAVQPLAIRDPEFLLVAYSSEPKILAANNPLTFMLPPRYDNYAQPFVATEMKTFGKKLALVGTSSAYGKQWADLIESEWKKQGGTVGRDNAVDYNTTVDFSAAVTKALSEKPDVLFIGGPSQPTALVIKAAREQGFKGGFIVMDQAKFEQMETVIPKNYLDGSVGVLPTRDFPGTQSFVVQYQRAYKKIPTSEAGLNYMGMNVLAKAMELAGTTSDPRKVRAQLDAAAKALPQSKTVYKVFGVTPQGHMDAEFLIASAKGGKYTKLRADKTYK
ncbi:MULTISPECIES: ABC transporter substrate-binding protein [Deinococcus]|jgi:amino acid/amide ABC transporter substrate-binding protein, HAAT family (TC 3.A.1.4.-)|uniref:ABC transporter substrate-binding protein n=1 Tax=Deinococcus radiodurans TaxID=1299 RepID=UPI0004851FA8|nr:ABC transporter substrate-binding protein [Deinococcus radiodurans]ANC72459.1 ethanolamine utilization protein EutJ [Deinococcus radiodurans R1 = ATCC 13939 = DSM 20539]QEM72243.1 ethanolamine utilization protein EutJ [Deinococcus radiodurans]QIP28487.1 ABC transporter substrate-binding protein [Deinococcus radiodurans]QIP32796.1 ABC transporter substrate-binding protein [Deinococcus radiodurans]UDK99476.1 ethanolamine utilization protein EutJ [Deinococcus radiodurans R1 = ATCC 13939 = DSM 